MNPLEALLTAWHTVRYYWTHGNETERSLLFASSVALLATVAQLVFVLTRDYQFHWLTITGTIGMVMGFAGFLWLVWRWNVHHVEQRANLREVVPGMVDTVAVDTEGVVLNRRCAITTADGVRHTFEYRHDIGWERI